MLYIDLVNYVATTLLPKYPKAHFNLLSYGASYTPPRDTKRFRMGPGTGVAFAHHWRNHGVPINCCERFMPRFLGWRDVCDRFLFWEYYTNFHIYVNPFPNTDIFGPAFKFYLDNKFDGGFCQMTNSRLTPFADLNWWVKNRIMWNPDADAQILVDHYIEGAYGPAAHHVRRYLDIILHAKRRQRWAWIGDYVDDTGNYLEAGDIIEIMRALQKALFSIAKDPNIGRRIDVRRLAFSINHLGAMRYPDLIEPAKAARFRLSPWQDYVNGWKAAAGDYLNSDECMGARQLANEGDGSGLRGQFRYFDMLKDTAEMPTAWPVRRAKARRNRPLQLLRARLPLHQPARRDQRANRAKQGSNLFRNGREIRLRPRVRLGHGRANRRRGPRPACPARQGRRAGAIGRGTPGRRLTWGRRGVASAARRWRRG